MDGCRSIKNKKTIVVIVAHPDDETLWCGGTILSHPNCDWYIVSLCRGKDPDRSPKFFEALKVLKAKGNMGDLDDGPEQIPLKPTEVETAILDLLPLKHFDMIISHSPTGEYTKHRRHEEVGRAAIRLWQSNRIAANCFWAFAYDDGNKKYLPKTIEKASIITSLSNQTWKKKYDIMTKIYGFENDSWEVQTTPKTEGFWQFTKPSEASSWLKSKKFQNPATAKKI